MSFFLALYRLLIRLYPRQFREEFAAEMEAVMGERLTDAVDEGVGALLRVCWRELRDWPIYCLQAHRQVRQQRVAVGSDGSLSSRETFIAALPHYLFALLTGGGTLIVFWLGAGAQHATRWFGYGTGLLLLAMLALAWWRGWPRWSASWLGYLFFAVFLLGVPVPVYDWLQRAGVSWNLSEVIRPDVALSLLWLAALYVLLQRWPRAGVVAMLPGLAVPWLLYLEFVPGYVTPLIMAATWVWLGIVTAIMVGRQRQSHNVWLLYLTGVLIGAVYVFAGHFLTDPQVRDRTLSRIVDDLLSDLLPVLVPLVGILLLHALRLWNRQEGPPTLLAYRLLLAGVLLAGVGVHVALGAVWLEEPSATAQRFGALLVLVIVLGLALMSASIALFVRNRTEWSATGRRLVWLLVGLLTFLPIIYSALSLRNAYPNLALGRPGRVFIPLWQLGYGLSIVWLLLAAFAIGRVQKRMPDRVSPENETRDAGSASFNAREPRSFMRIGLRYLLAVGMLTVVFLPDSWVASLIPNPDLSAEPFHSTLALLLFLRAALTLVVAAVVLHPALTNYLAWWDRRRRRLLATCTLSGLLLVKGVHSLYWLFIWDRTTDPLHVFWLPIPIIGVLMAGAVLTTILPGKRKLTGGVYTVAITALVIAVFAYSQRIDVRQLTAARAERVAHALEVFHTRNGRYPETLEQLTPWTTLSVGGPVIIYQQSWCYQSGRDFYRLGYVDREHWSDPRLIGRIAHTAGDAPERPPVCAEEVEALQARFGDYPYTYWKDEAQSR